MRTLTAMQHWILIAAVARGMRHSVGSGTFLYLTIRDGW
eukprot:COSAG02_NODE_2309_length_9170_cov_10.752508_6_plen_39_part_00